MIKRSKSSKYKTVSVGIFRDNKLSAKAKGIWGYVMTLPELKTDGTPWDISVKNIVNNFKEERKAIYSGINELIKFGYVGKHQTNTKGFSKVEYTFYDEAQTLLAGPQEANPQNALPRKGDSKEYISKESTIKENIKEEIIIKDKENTKKKSPWCETIFKHWNSKNLIKHRSYPNSGKRTFNSITLGLSADCKLYEIMDAIDNYEMIVNDPKFYFRYRWGLADFLIRGFDNFKDKEIAVTNYLKSDVKILTEHEFAEITFRYERAFENVNDMIERGTADETDRDEIVEALKEQLKKFYIPKDLQQDLHNMAFGIPKL